MNLLLIVSLFANSAIAADCPGIVRVAETRSNSWNWTRESADEMKNITYENHFWEWLYMAPLTILSVPGDMMAMPFRRRGTFVRGSISGVVEGPDGKALADFPWKAWPWKYQDHPGVKAFMGEVRSFRHPCSASDACKPEDIRSDQFEFGTDASGGFVFTFEGFIVRKGWLEVAFGPPLDRTIRVYREKKGKIVARDPASGEELCQLTLRESPAATPAR